MNKEINTHFNIWATVALWSITLVVSIATYDVEQGHVSKTLLDVVFKSLTANILVSLAMAISIALVLSKLFQEVWNRLISDLFKLRHINFNESYAINIVMVWVVFG